MKSFSGFYGNSEVIHRLREMLARDRFPHGVILAGPQGAGKYTLALMLARTMNCQGIGKSSDRVARRSEERFAGADGLPDFCGKCENCRRIAEAEDLDARFAEAVEAREGLRETDKRDGKIVGTSKMTVSPDGKWITVEYTNKQRGTTTTYKMEKKS